MEMHFLPVSDFDQLPQIHDTDLIRDVTHHGQIVRDKQIGDAFLFLIILEQIDDLGLNGNIERRDGLIADHQIRLKHQCPRNPDTLSLPAGELVRVAACMLSGQPDTVQHLIDQIVGRRLVWYDAVGDQRLRNDVPDSHSRVQRGVWILENHLHLFSERLQFLL